MNKREILDYVFKFWNNRKTLNKCGLYSPILETNDRIIIKTPWGTTHHSVTFCGETWVYFFWIDQYHYKGLEKQEEIFKLTKKQFYNKLKAQQRVLEHSYLI